MSVKLLCPTTLSSTAVKGRPAFPVIIAPIYTCMFPCIDCSCPQSILCPVNYHPCSSQLYINRRSHPLISSNSILTITQLPPQRLGKATLCLSSFHLYHVYHVPQNNQHLLLLILLPHYHLRPNISPPLPTHHRGPNDSNFHSASNHQDTTHRPRRQVRS